jgi:hypothetical protein
MLRTVIAFAHIAGLVAGNGVLLLRAERQVQRGDAAGWPHMHRTAVVSLVLWFATTLAGAALPNIG